jgi:hypothetical protein
MAVKKRMVISKNQNQNQTQIQNQILNIRDSMLSCREAVKFYDIHWNQTAGKRTHKLITSLLMCSFVSFVVQ